MNRTVSIGELRKAGHTMDALAIPRDAANCHVMHFSRIHADDIYALPDFLPVAQYARFKQTHPDEIGAVEIFRLVWQ